MLLHRAFRARLSNVRYLLAQHCAGLTAWPSIRDQPIRVWPDAGPLDQTGVHGARGVNAAPCGVSAVRVRPAQRFEHSPARGRDPMRPNDLRGGFPTMLLWLPPIEVEHRAQSAKVTHSARALVMGTRKSVAARRGCVKFRAPRGVAQNDIWRGYPREGPAAEADLKLPVDYRSLDIVDFGVQQHRGWRVP